jgi:hypothetical protein
MQTSNTALESPYWYAGWPICGRLIARCGVSCESRDLSTLCFSLPLDGLVKTRVLREATRRNEVNTPALGGGITMEESLNEMEPMSGVEPLTY